MGRPNGPDLQAANQGPETSYRHTPDRTTMFGTIVLQLHPESPRRRDTDLARPADAGREESDTYDRTGVGIAS